ncbi:hypothetical protein M1446_05590 [Candidatus Dependentiae bacterium]|nr:hypothetical protein [Candidatus Dependentiae bacterium]
MKISKSLFLVSLLNIILPTIIMGNSLEFRVGNFFPASNYMRDNYKHGGVEFEAEGGFGLSNNSTIWININSSHHKSLGFFDPSTINIYPLSAGVKYFIPISKYTNFYLGIGPSLSFIKIHDNSIFMTDLHKTAWGAVGKSGFLWFLSKHFFIDFYADFYYTRVFLGGNSRNIGGWRVGIGLGINF